MTYEEEEHICGIRRGSQRGRDGQQEEEHGQEERWEEVGGRSRLISHEENTKALQK